MNVESSSDHTTSAQRSIRKPRRRRYIMGIMLMLMITIGYIDRVNISIAGPAIQEEFGLSASTLGILFSAFFWGYAAMMIPGGWLLDRFGKRIILPVAVFGWTLAAIATGLTSRVGALLGLRILLGIGEAPAYPAGNLTIREWAPLKERGVFTSLLQVGSLFGPAVATAPAALLVAQFGWRASFFILGSLGFVWLAGWLILYRRPEEAWWLDNQEREHIVRNRDATEDPSDTISDQGPSGESVGMSIPKLLRQTPMLGILGANGAQTYAAYFFLTWLPTYLVSEDRGFSLSGSGLLTSAIYLVALVGAVSLGYASDRWLSLSQSQARRGNRRKVVALLMIVSLILVAIVPQLESSAALVVAIGVTLIAVTTSITLTFALTNDLIVDESSGGRTFGLVSFGGQIIGLLAPIVTGFVVDASGFGPVFIITAAVLLAGTLAVWFLPTRPLQPVGEGVGAQTPRVS